MAHPQYELFLKEQIHYCIQAFYEENWKEEIGESVEATAKRSAALYERAGVATKQKAVNNADLLFLRWKCQNDLYFLGTEVFGMKNAINISNGRKRIDPKLHQQMCAEIERDEDSLLLYPRNHLKSSWLKIYAIQLILKNPMVRIGMWTKTTKLARKELKSIKAYLRNKKLQKIFPDIIKKRFQVDNAEELTVWRPDDCAVQENQIEIWGVDSTVTGHHYDYHLYDDIIDQNSVKDAGQITQIRDWWEYMQNILDLGATEKIVGTRYHLMDIYGHIILEGHYKPENMIIRSAIENGKPIYSMYTLSDLAKLKYRS